MKRNDKKMKNDRKKCEEVIKKRQKIQSKIYKSFCKKEKRDKK